MKGQSNTTTTESIISLRNLLYLSYLSIYSGYAEIRIRILCSTTQGGDQLRAMVLLIRMDDMILKYPLMIFHSDHIPKVVNILVHFGDPEIKIAKKSSDKSLESSTKIFPGPLSVTKIYPFKSNFFHFRITWIIFIWSKPGLQ